jgi:hypothetical protein
MKKTTLYLAILFVLISCKKNNGPGQSQLENYPQTWILTVDQAPDEYLFLKTNGAVMYKDDVPQSYNMVTLAEEEECEWEIMTSLTEEGNKTCFTIRLDKNKKWWAGASPSSDKQEIHMTVLNTTSTDPGDNYKWFIHKMPDVNGVKTVVLENVYYPGYYVSTSSPGWQFAQNLVTLQQTDNPQKATYWQCR